MIYNILNMVNMLFNPYNIHLNIYMYLYLTNNVMYHHIYCIINMDFIISQIFLIVMKINHRLYNQFDNLLLLHKFKIFINFHYNNKHHILMYIQYHKYCILLMNYNLHIQHHKLCIHILMYHNNN